MSSIIRNPKDFWSGILFIVFGLGAVWLSWDYPMGKAGRMGPGYFPTMLGWLLAAIGGATLVRSFFSKKGEPIGKLAVKETLIVISGIVLFGVIVRDAGIMPAVFLLVVISSLASTKFGWIPVLAMATGSAVFCWVVFVYLLGLPLKAFGSWFGF